jgi:hypothetical protein
MGNNFLHFNRRDVRLRFPNNPDDPWFSELQPDFGGFEKPRYHVTRADDGPAADVKPGDTIWLVGQLYAPWGKLPAALDARIEVASCRRRRNAKGIRFSASPSSRWFPLADVTSVLLTLQSCRSDGNINPVLKDGNRHIGQCLRRMRRLVSGALLRRWEAELDSKGFHFISYRICDGTRAAFDKAKDLASQGIPFFWDRWSLPRRLAERREAVGDHPLDATIEASIRKAAVVWGIESNLYGHPGSYAAHERELAQRLNKYQTDLF